MVERYWAMMTDKKFTLLYLGCHHHINVKIERWFDIALAVISTGSLGALFIFEEYQMILSIVLALSQIITAARPYMPFRYRMKELDKGIFLLNTLYNEIESKWNSIAVGEVTDDELNKLYYDFVQRWDELDHEILKRDSLPRRKMYIKQAQKEKEKYFEIIFGGNTNE